MAHGKSDSDIIQHTHNTARFFTENRHISWMLLIATMLWGVYGYIQMPKRKDPKHLSRWAAAYCVWPGANAEKVEQLVTRKIEEKCAQNSRVEKIESISRSSISVVYVTLDIRVTDAGKEFDDIKLKLDSIRDLPQGAGTIEFIKDFGESTALMLTVASPKVDEVDIALRGRDVSQAIKQVRSQIPPSRSRSRATGVLCFPPSLNPRVLARPLSQLVRYMEEKHIGRDHRLIYGSGFVGIDAEGEYDDAAISAFVQQFVRERLHASELHPDVWPVTVIRDPSETQARLRTVAGDKFSYRELDDLTDLISRTLQSLPQVSKVTRYGILKERIFLDYSQERLASYGIQPAALVDILSARNITLPGGLLEIGEKNLNVNPSGEFKSEKEIGDVLIAATSSGSPVYLRDGVDIVREYESPPRFLNYYTWRDNRGQWNRSRAATLAVFLRPGEQIAEFGTAVDTALTSLKSRLPEKLVLARTSDQPLQTKENVDLFMKSLYEAIFLVVLVALVGFREWRSAVLMATSIPLTLAMTFGMMYLLGIDIQQVSIASLIIALGLLVDDPVVAGDAIKRELAAGHPPIVAAWLGPTKLARAILYATITNIVAYLPLLLVGGDTGQFIYSLPIVLTCSLVASRIVSMTFIPLLGYYLLRPGRKPEMSLEERRRRGFSGFYYRLGSIAIERRWQTFCITSLVFLGLGVYLLSQLRTQFFPKDLSYLSFVDVWLPEDAPLSATNEAATRAQEAIRQTAAEYGRQKNGKPQEILESITTFVGGGGPRFWFSVAPQLQQLNYAQLILQVKDKHDTGLLAPLLQKELSARVPGAVVDMRQLEISPLLEHPVSIHILGEDARTLRDLAERVKEIFRSIPKADRVRDNWGAESFVVNLQVDPDRANLAGVSNLDVAASSAAGMSGFQVTTLREGNEQIPVMVRLRADERARLSDVQNLYVFSLRGADRVPLQQVSSVTYAMETEKLRRRNHFHAITVSCFPVSGGLAAEVLNAARPRLMDFERTLPPGYQMKIGGEEERRLESFNDMTVAMVISVICIFLTLVIQFNHAVKPLLVFAAIPYGMVGAFAALAVMGAPFGIMAFLGVASLIGVIISHVIVLFDFVEEMHEKGEPLREALLDAGIVRLRPVAVTVGATVFGLIPLVMHGGPLWEALCYAQIGGLLLANFITKLLVPALYAIFVLDLKIVKWEAKGEPVHTG